MSKIEKEGKVQGSSTPRGALSCIPTRAHGCPLPGHPTGAELRFERDHKDHLVRQIFQLHCLEPHEQGTGAVQRSLLLVLLLGLKNSDFPICQGLFDATAWKYPHTKKSCFVWEIFFQAGEALPLLPPHPSKITAPGRVVTGCFCGTSPT